MLELTMTEKLQHQDMFRTINIPKSERRLAMRAKNLFDATSDSEAWDPAVHARLMRTTQNSTAFQNFWEYDNEDRHTYDRLALTLIQRGLIIAIEHRDFDKQDERIRKSLLISQGVSKVYTSDLLGRPDMGIADEGAVTLFKKDFLVTTANLGLYTHAKRLHSDQSESDSAIFANAA